MDQRLGTPGADPSDTGTAAVGDTTVPGAAEPTVKPPSSILGTVLLGLVAPLLTGALAAILVLFVAACLPGAPRSRELVSWGLHSAPGLAALILLQNAMIVVFAWWLARQRSLPAWSWLRLHLVRLDGTSYLLLLVLAAGVFGLGALAAHWGRQLGLPGDATAVNRLIQLMRTAPGMSWLVLVLAMGVGPGFGEEIWVRGHILRSLQARCRTRWAILASAVIFTLLHLDPAHMLFALPFGLVFGWLTVRTDSILPGILCHAFVNSGVNLARAIEVRRPDYTAEFQTADLHATDVAALLLLAAAGVVSVLLLELRFRQAARVGQEATPAVASEERP